MSSIASKLQMKSQRAAATKQVRLKLVYLDFWSAVKLAFLISITLGIVLVVVNVLVWIVLDTTGVFDSIDGMFGSVLNEKNFSITASFSLAQVAAFSTIVAILNVAVGTAIGAIIATLYNLSVRITGGLLVGFTNN